jgi:uncharacterized protein (TIGR03790 family)
MCKGKAMNNYRASLAGFLVCWAFSLRLWAGGSGLNVVVVVNQNSTNSLQLGNAYCELRGVPPQNVLRLTNWTGGAIEWYRTNFNTLLLNPLLSMVAARGLTNQAQFVLLSMDIPYRIRDTDSFVSQDSTTAAVFYGFKSYTSVWGTCSLPDPSSNSYAFSELPFAQAPPNTAVTNSFLTVMLTHSNLAAAELVLSRGIASDSTFPTQTAYLAKTSDQARDVRFTEFDNAIFSCRVGGDNSLLYTNTDSTSFTNSLGLLTGLATLTLPPSAFVPGAIGDSLTSFAGDIFGNSGQTPLLVFLTAGAAGSYGTVVEPCAYTQKFPDPRDYFYQARGFCMAEAYYQSLLNPYLGLVVGEPLSAPFARQGTAAWSSLTDGTVLSGQVTLSPGFSAATTNLPLGQVDLFVDGSFLHTMTNLPPAAGNRLSVNLNGTLVNYTVSANATVASVVNDLAGALNGRVGTTHVQAYAVGDRVELEAQNVASAGSGITLSASTSLGSASQLTTLLTPARSTFLDSIATGYLTIWTPPSTPAIGDWLQLNFTKTNNTHVVVSVTNTVAGTSIATLLTSLFNLVNATPALQSADGALAADFVDYTPYGDPASFNLYARTPGGPASQIHVTFTASSDLQALPSGSNQLQDNLRDLEPRSHLYASSGLLSLPVHFALDTTQLPDGCHQLTAVAYEGTSVRTQTRITRNVWIQNTPLSATFTILYGSSNTAVSATLQFSVVANTNNIARIELFSTGGSLGSVLNQSNATFSVAGTNLDVGLHPFYALVTASSGKQYRTVTQWIRLVGPEPPFQVSLAAPPPVLRWPSTAGRSYDILSATNITNAFQLNLSLTPSNTTAQWTDTNPAVPRRFYRVRTSN